MSIDDANSMLAGGSKVPSAKFAAVNDHIKGIVVDADEVQARNFEDNELAFWKDGKPKMQLVLTLQTDLRDPAITDDDGRRRLYALNPSELLRAISDATHGQGHKLEAGGTLAVIHTGTRPHEKAGFSPIKLYEAAYEPAKAAGVAGLLAGASAPAEATPSDPAPQPAVASAAGLL